MGTWRTVFHTTADIVVRSRWVLLVYVFALSISGGSFLTRGLGVGMVVMLGFIAGAYFVLKTCIVRAAYVVPVTPRERWLVVMTLVSILMPLCLVVGTLVGSLYPWARPADEVLEPLLVATGTAWAYCSVAVLWLPLFEAAARVELIPQVELNGRKVRPRFEAKFLFVLILFGVGLAALWLPLKLADHLPVRFSDFTAAKGAVAALGGFGALFAWWYTPAAHVPGLPRSIDALQPRTDPDLRRIRRLDQLTGPARLLVPQGLLVGTGTMAVLVLNALASRFFGSYFGDLDDGTKWFAAAVVGLSFIAPFNSMRRLLRIVPLPVGARVWLPIAGQALNACAVILCVLLIQQFADTPWPTGAMMESAMLLFGLSSVGAALVSRFELQPSRDGRAKAGPLAMGLAIGSANIVADIWKRVVPPSAEGTVAVTVGMASLLIAVLLLSQPTIRRRASASSPPPSSSQTSSQPAASS